MRTFDTSLPNERPTHDTSKLCVNRLWNEYTSREGGKYLGFVLQTAEGGGEDKAVIVTLEFRAVFMAFLVKLFQSEAFGRYERIPIHHDVI